MDESKLFLTPCHISLKKITNKLRDVYTKMNYKWSKIIVEHNKTKLKPPG